MRLVPTVTDETARPSYTQSLEVIQWFERRAENWRDVALDIGLSHTLADEVCQCVKTAHRAAKHADLSGDLEALQAATDALLTVGDQAVEMIRAFAFWHRLAEAVLIAADLPRETEPAIGPPAPQGVWFQRDAADADAQASASSSITVRWAGVNQGGFFQLHRQVQNAAGEWGVWQWAGAVRETRFADSNLPSDAAAVRYRVQAVKANTRSGWSEIAEIDLAATPHRVGIAEAA